MKGERKMDFGVTGKLGGYYLAEQYRKNAAADTIRGHGRLRMTEGLQVRFFEGG